MILIEKIVSIYSDLSNYDWADGDIRLQNDGDGDIRLQNDGDGDYIAKWEHPTLAQPTQEQLDAVGEE